MMTKDTNTIGEVVELLGDGTIVLELHTIEFHVMDYPLLSCFSGEEEILFLGMRIYKDSIDKTRRAVALHMTSAEIESEYPQASLLIRPYLSALLLGTIQEERFASGVQPSNIGIHSQFCKTTDQQYRWILNNNKILVSLLSQIAQNPITKPMLKTISRKLLQLDQSAEARSILFRTLGSILREDYFTFKEITMYVS